MKLSLQLKTSQQLTITPQLQHAIRLLQLPVLELNSEIEQALAENVMLECEEPESTEPETPQEDIAVVSQESDVADLWNDRVGPGSRNDSWSDDMSRPELADHSGETLQDHLIWQLEMESFSPREVVIGHALVEYINDDGYLTEPLESIHESLVAEANFSFAEISTTLTKIQALDPIGVAARDLSECIQIQVRNLDAQEQGKDLAIKIAAEFLDLVAEHDYATLRRRLGVSEDDLEAALTLVRACHPRPGSAIQSSTAEYITPDVFVRKQDNKWIVEVNRSIAPRLKVNQTYAALLKGNGQQHANLKNQLQEARWLVRSLEIRHDTMLKVAMCIIERQIDFLEHGEEVMKPMVLRDVAEVVEMHESTISRVTANKYMHTPRGVFEFRYFFSSHLGASDGTEQSSTAIRAKIRRLIGQENPKKPLSDSKLEKLLEDEGITVARRTVAKYRESMKIGTSSERKHRTH
jgi:RNA polymerase sigma-54 factor